jgi:uncharacterized protein (UPF0332 family)
MKELFTTRSHQNLQASRLLFDAALFDASVNRSYYAVFDAAFADCLHFGIPVQADHAKVLRAFCGKRIERRKIFPAVLKGTLYEMQSTRIRANYGASAISKNVAQTTIKTADWVCSTIFERIES